MVLYSQITIDGLYVWGEKNACSNCVLLLILIILGVEELSIPKFETFIPFNMVYGKVLPVSVVNIYEKTPSILCVVKFCN